MKPAFAVALALLTGCVLEPKVVRVYDGRMVEGAYVPPEAYAAYLRGVLAEESGDLSSALAAYESAAREDDGDAEPLTRVGDVRCRLDPKARGADEAFDRAAKIDPTYTPLLEARARCSVARGKPQEAATTLAKVAVEDRTSASVEALSVTLGTSRERAIALSLASDLPVAWEALVTWGRSKNDPVLMQRGWLALVRYAPDRQEELERGVLELVGRGEPFFARELAAALVDKGAVRDDAVVRLGLDEAILRDDVAALERRATHGHVDLGEVAARALLLERPRSAKRIAERVLDADPGSGCAAMVLSAERARTGQRMALRTRPHDRPSVACALVFAERVAVSDVEAARVWLMHVGTDAFVLHDPVVGRAAVELAARGALADAALPLELRLELAARRRETPPPADPAAVDAKHMLLWHVLVDPTGAPAQKLAAKLAGAAERDPIIGFALTRMALATGGEALARARKLVAAGPADPLLLAAALELAKREGKSDEIPPARARLSAVARTAAERALVTGAQ